MKSVRVSFQALIFALTIGIVAIAARPAWADVEDLIIQQPTNTVAFHGIAPADVEVTFQWSHGYFFSIPQQVQGYQATITIGPLSDPLAQQTVAYATDELGLVPPYEMTETLSIPAGTDPGCYDLTVKVEELQGESFATADPCCGQELTESAAVCIDESMAGEPRGVPIDIKPGSCPNPIETSKRGMIPVAIVGTEDFDVDDIDPQSIRLMGVTPLRFAYEDVATPFYPFVGKQADCLGCTDARGDGILDLTLKFDSQELVEGIRWCYGDGDLELSDRACLILFLDGQLEDGTPIVGEDVVRIQDRRPGRRGEAGSEDSGEGKPQKSSLKKSKSAKASADIDKSDKTKSGRRKGRGGQ